MWDSHAQRQTKPSPHPAQRLTPRQGDDRHSPSVSSAPLDPGTGGGCSETKSGSESGCGGQRASDTSPRGSCGGVALGLHRQQVSGLQESYHYHHDPELNKGARTERGRSQASPAIETGQGAFRGGWCVTTQNRDK